MKRKCLVKHTLTYVQSEMLKSEQIPLSGRGSITDTGTNWTLKSIDLSHSIVEAQIVQTAQGLEALETLKDVLNHPAYSGELIYFNNRLHSKY